MVSYWEPAAKSNIEPNLLHSIQMHFRWVWYKTEDAWFVPTWPALHPCGTISALALAPGVLAPPAFSEHTHMLSTGPSQSLFLECPFNISPLITLPAPSPLFKYHHRLPGRPSLWDVGILTSRLTSCSRTTTFFYLFLKCERPAELASADWFPKCPQ